MSFGCSRMPYLALPQTISSSHSESSLHTYFANRTIVLKDKWIFFQGERICIYICIYVSKEIKKQYSTTLNNLKIWYVPCIYIYMYLKYVSVYVLIWRCVKPCRRQLSHQHPLESAKPACQSRQLCERHLFFAKVNHWKSIGKSLLLAFGCW